MKDLLHSRFIQTVLSADMSTEPTEAMEYYQEFYMAATSLLSGDWGSPGKPCVSKKIRHRCYRA